MIEIQNLRFTYGRKKKLFENLNLNLSDGRIYGLLGRNGAGKTTLLKVIAGLRFPQKGKCQVLGFDSRRRLPVTMKDIYIIPEQFDLPAVKGNLFKSTYAPFYPAFNNEHFSHYMREFEIDTNEILTHLSHGQKKKFLLGFALATNTRILLLDEPTNGLDIPSKSQFRRIVASSVANDRIVIISTHQVRDTDGLIDAVVILDEGEIIFNESLDEVARKLVFKKAVNEDDLSEKLYSESVLGGSFYVEENKTLEETKVDLEFLFNAVTRNKKRVNLIFNPVNHEE
jgi:ABC-2 type transport system ATP-binding protein